MGLYLDLLFQNNRFLAGTFSVLYLPGYHILLRIVYLFRFCKLNVHTHTYHISHASWVRGRHTGSVCDLLVVGCETLLRCPQFMHLYLWSRPTHRIDRTGDAATLDNAHSVRWRSGGAREGVIDARVATLVYGPCGREGDGCAKLNARLCREICLGQVVET